MTNLSIDISDELADQLKPYSNSIEEVLAAGLREMRLIQSLGLYRQRTISVWKAAKLANVSLREMILFLRAHGVQPEMDPEEVEDELA